MVVPGTSIYMPRRSKPVNISPGKSVKSRDGSPSMRHNITAELGAPLHLQQKCLNVFRDALDPDFQDGQTIQEVKGYLYNREFAAAFGKDEYLRVYAARWSPSRALGYLQIMADIQKHFMCEKSGSSLGSRGGCKVVCLGGGAGAELVGLSGWANMLSETTSRTSLQILLVDKAPWDRTVAELYKGIVTAPQMSKFAPAAARETNFPLLPEDAISVEFRQVDVLDCPELDFRRLVVDADLVTLMFTLNELYSVSLAKAQRLLSQIEAIVAPGTLLLVVDSPGSYSTVALNGTEKRYPMQWLLDIPFLGPQPKAETKLPEAKWEKVVSDASRWFRLPAGLQYPIELENMRYQIHLFKRIGGPTES